MPLLDRRINYKPFLYPQAHDFWLKQQQAHWLSSEVTLNQDLLDWNMNLTPSEKSVIGGILKGFTQTEIFVNDYWSNKVGRWFQHPEIVMAATTMASFETIHTQAYSLLDETLGFADYEAFLADPNIKAKIDRLVETGNIDTTEMTIEKKMAMAKSLAVFSAFTEGVSLFSSFAVLLHFSRYNKMKGMSQIVTWSIKDETLHSEFGCYLFRTFIEENKEIWTDEFKKEIYQAARDTVSLEDNFIDSVFEKGDIEGLSKEDLKDFIRHRANMQLGKLGLKQNWKNVDKDALKRMEWFDAIGAGVRLDDFFSVKPTDYSRGVVNFDDMF
jgi:ribonucleoside-diphosphate reductase beta chain